MFFEKNKKETKRQKDRQDMKTMINKIKTKDRHKDE